MDRETKHYKRIFKNALEPIIVMLRDRRSTMTILSWNKFVQQTRAHIIENPVEFIGDDLPNKNLLVEIVEIIFNEFLLGKTKS